MQGARPLFFSQAQHPANRLLRPIASIEVNGLCKRSRLVAREVLIACGTPRHAQLELRLYRVAAHDADRERGARRAAGRDVAKLNRECSRLDRLATYGHASDSRRTRRAGNLGQGEPIELGPVSRTNISIRCGYSHG